mmetsp:Transcript_18165/g.36631  ORF Transcript_18165/g.36631 Transcript_18165/m.36631 type:complete len:93 (+) Transcript_18165:361-639(+)
MRERTERKAEERLSERKSGAEKDKESSKKGGRTKLAETQRNEDQKGDRNSDACALQFPYEVCTGACRFCCCSLICTVGFSIADGLLCAQTMG